VSGPLQRSQQTVFYPWFLEKMADIDRWLDEDIPDFIKDQPLAQDLFRIIKLAEESGELVDAFTGVKGANPRKGFYDSPEHFLEEGADVLLTALYMINHFTKNPNRTADIIRERLQFHHKRMVKSIAEKRNHP
jgi:NTP pyrophosphatase (non-canonical NTP hydrolase)